MNGIIRTTESPIGEITLGATENGLVLCATGTCAGDLVEELGKRGITLQSEQETETASRASQILDMAEKALRLFFAGEFSALQSVPLALTGTDFQQSVWLEMQGIRAGEVMSYSAVAEALKNPGAVRAVGLACRLNPTHLFVPCHRVVSIDGELTGFRGGIELKKWLLDHESSLSKHESIAA